MADIAGASAEQASGIEQVNKALTQMDEVTQQNSALVEENAATAKTLAEQSAAMDDRVTFFKLDQSAAAGASRPVASRPAASAPRAPAGAAKRPAPAPKAAPKRAANGSGGPVGRMQAALATAVQTDPDWKEF